MDFYDYLRTANLAPRSIAIYDQWIRRLERWCWQHRIIPDQITRDEIAVWADTIPASWSSRTQARKAIRHWALWLGRTDEPHEAIWAPRRPRYACRALTRDEMSKLKATALLIGGREGLATLCGMYLAARRAEIAALTWDGYTGERMRWTRVKTGDTAELPVHPVLAGALDERKPRATSVYIFPGDRGRPHVSPTTVWEWVRHVGRMAGVALAPHQLRHSMLATVNDATGDLRAAQEIAGHHDPSQTAIYTRATQTRVAAAIGSLDW